MTGTEVKVGNTVEARRGHITTPEDNGISSFEILSIDGDWIRVRQTDTLEETEWPFDDFVNGIVKT